MNVLNFSHTPEISIILPTYNRAGHLNDCITSVVNQTFTDWELLVVDDGSHDRSFEVVDSFLQNFENIRYLKHKNRKQGYSRNAGIQASFGQYITFIDSDDKYKPDHLQTRLDFMKANHDIDLIEGGFESDEDIWLVDYFQPDKKINLRECVLGPTFFGKRHVFFELEGFNNVDFEDPELWERAEKRFKTYKIKQPETYIYTRAEKSLTKDFIEKYFAETT